MPYQIMPQKETAVPGDKLWPFSEALIARRERLVMLQPRPSPELGERCLIMAGSSPRRRWKQSMRGEPRTASVALTG